MVVSSKGASTADTTAHEVWLTDASGAYAVLALALGRGATRIKTLLTKQQQQSRTGMDGLYSFLSMLNTTTACVVELAIVHDKKLQRFRLEQIHPFGQKSKSVLQFASKKSG